MESQTDTDTAQSPDAVTAASDIVQDLRAADSASEVFSVLLQHPLTQTAIWIISVLLLALIVHLIAKHVVLRFVAAFVKRSRTTWDDALRQRNVFDRLVPVVPLMVIHSGLTWIPNVSEEAQQYMQRLVLATIVLIVARALSAMLTAVNDIYCRYEISRGRPIKGYLQVIKIIAYITAGIVVIAAVVQREPWFFLSGMGAMMAVILLIFRDTILSLVAGIQISGNDLLRVGDWIEMPQFNADGDVIDISLNVVKVQNWDRTVTCIPTHKFLENSFKNWRSMFDGGGRRIKRSLFIDMSTIRFLTEAEIRKFRDFLVLKNYICTKMQEVDTYNAQLPGEKAKIVANARHLTNVGTFRAYVLAYLKNHPKVHQELTLLVRQLAPTAQGLPLEIYAFTNDTSWGNYEGIQSDIFDHLLAVAPEFGLRVYQQPAGSDLANLSRVTATALSDESETRRTADSRTNGKG